MALSIPLTGLSQNDPVPGTYIEINFAQGPASSGGTDYSVLLMGNKLSTGTALDGYIYGPDTEVALTSEADAILLFGAGSELHRMVKRFLKVNRSSTLYCIPVAESAGNKATGTITITGTATAPSSLRVKLGDEVVESPIFTGDTPTVQAAALVAAIQAKTNWAASASNSGGTVTLEAKQRGPRGNTLRFSARVLSACGVTVTPTASSVPFSGGTTSDSIQAALDVIAPHRHYYIVPACDDQTQINLVANQVDAQALPIVGIRQRAIFGSVDSLATATTVATGINKARCELVWQQSSDLTPGELAANAAAVYSLFEAPAVPRLNFSGFGSDAVTSQSWVVRAPSAGTAPTRTQLRSALNNGITPIGVGKAGATYLVKRVTTRSLSGSVSDYRIRDAHKVTVCDRFADDLVTKQVAQLSGKLIGNDTPPSAPAAGANVVTPQVLKALIIGLVNEYAANSLLEDVPGTIRDIQVIREVSPTTRLSARIPLNPSDILDQLGNLVDQIG